MILDLGFVVSAFTCSVSFNLYSTPEVGSHITFLFHKTQRMCTQSHTVSKWLCLVLTHQPMVGIIFRMRRHSEEVAQLGSELRSVFTVFALTIINKAHVEVCF